MAAICIFLFMIINVIDIIPIVGISEASIPFCYFLLWQPPVSRQPPPARQCECIAILFWRVVLVVILWLHHDHHDIAASLARFFLAAVTDE